MELGTHVLALALVLFLCSCLSLLASEDSVKVGKSITGNQRMVSAGGSFALGFFTPGNSTFTYLGIWYNNIPEQTVIWVANRQSPITRNSAANFTIGDGDGNLVLSDDMGKLLWSSNVSSSSNSAVGVLLDNGNLVLMHGESNLLWQSFEHPTDMFMPDMKLGYNKTTGQRTQIVSWISNEDPRPGNFSLGTDPEGHLQFYIWKHTTISFRFDNTKIYHGGNLVGTSWYISIVSGKDGIFVTYAYNKGLMTLRVVLTPSGYLEVRTWLQIASMWGVLFRAPQVPCEHYAQCGPFGSCGITPSGLCRCLTGFEPRYQKDWQTTSGMEVV